MAGIIMDEILKTDNRSSELVFQKFYYKPGTVEPAAFGRSVLRFISISF